MFSVSSVRAELFPSMHCGILAAAPGVNPVRAGTPLWRGRAPAMHLSDCRPARSHTAHSALSTCTGPQESGPRSCRARPARGEGARRKNKSGVSAAIVVTVGYAVYRVVSDRVKCNDGVPRLPAARYASSIYRSALTCLANGFPETINHTHMTSRRLPRCYVCADASLRLRLEQRPHVSTVIDASLSEHHEPERRVDQAHAADAQPQGEYGSRARRRSAHAWGSTSPSTRPTRPRTLRERALGAPLARG